MNALFVPRDTKAVLQPLPVKDCSRSLYFDRYSRPDLPNDDRQQFFTGGFTAHTSTIRCASWAIILQRMPAVVLHAQLQSRLMVNMAGGVMENAGLCLDRFGLPYLPGSAVKGCARRTALATLHEWCETGLKPGATAEDQDNLFKAACANFATPADMLTAIARAFGWGEQDWKTRDDFRSDDEWAKRRSDFAWACGDHWKTTRAETLTLLESAPANGPGARAPRRKDLAGSVAFLPAYPVDLEKTGTVDGLPLPVPALGKLELDVVTCHHGKYYAEPDRAKKPRKWEEWHRQWGTAPDTEEPVPVVFPTVAAGHVFAFALVSLRGKNAKLLEPPEQARAWLKIGLETFGVGAKTNAGYGWFAEVALEYATAFALLKMGVPAVQRSICLAPRVIRGSGREEGELDLVFNWAGKLWVVDCKDRHAAESRVEQVRTEILREINPGPRLADLLHRIEDELRERDLHPLKEDLLAVAEVGGLLGQAVCVRRTPLPIQAQEFADSRRIAVVMKDQLLPQLRSLLYPNEPASLAQLQALARARTAARA